jgi:hypothetical protein
MEGAMAENTSREGSLLEVVIQQCVDQYGCWAVLQAVVRLVPLKDHEQWERWVGQCAEGLTPGGKEDLGMMLYLQGQLEKDLARR